MKRRSIPESLAILANVAGILGFVGSIVNSCQVRRTQQEFRSLATCGDVAISIERPSSDQGVSATMIAIGKADVHPTCKFVYLVVRSMSQGHAQYRITDGVQVDKEGQWRARISLEDVLVGETADVEALLTSNPKIYQVNDLFPLPPDKGGRSNTIHVTRIGGG